MKSSPEYPTSKNGMSVEPLLSMLLLAKTLTPPVLLRPKLAQKEPVSQKN
ncbi:hypothetical protein [Candidatus Southlakia epibionticum]